MEDIITKGEALFNDGQIAAAEKCFLSILGDDPGNKAALNNLGVIAYNDCRNEDAIDFFSRALASDPFYKDAVTNYAHLLKGLRLLPEASELIAKNVDRYPDDAELRRLLAEAQKRVPRRLKMAVVCLPGLESFLVDIVEQFQHTHDIRTCYSGKGDDVGAAVQWADVVWIEWANQLAISLTNHPTLLKGKHVICRLHRYESYTNMPGQVNWSAVDDLIFVAPHVKERLKLQIADIDRRVRTHIVYNGINLDRFRFVERQPGFDLAYVGFLNHLKNPPMLLQCLRQLVNIDDRYRLHVAGEFQGAEYSTYFKHMVSEMGLDRHIRLDGWVKDIPTWLTDKQYLVHTSMIEGHPVGIMEAMACGIKPVIHNFVGAGEIYPERYLWNTVEEFTRKITAGDYSSAEYRQFIATNYSLARQIDSIASIIPFEPPEKKPVGVVEVSGAKEPADRARERHGSETAAGDPRRWYNNFLGVLKNDHNSQNPRHLRVQQALSQIIKPGMRVLDIGCGTGISSRFMGERGARVVGVDLSDKLIAFAQKESAHPNVSYMVQDASRLHLNATFDAITVIDSMEHVPRERIEAFVACVCGHAAAGTIIYINIPDGRYQRFVKANHPEKLQIIDEDYDPNHLIDMFQAHGFQPYQVSIYGIDLPVQYNEYLFMTGQALEDVYRQSYRKLGIG